MMRPTMRVGSQSLLGSEAPAFCAVMARQVGNIADPALSQLVQRLADRLSPLQPALSASGFALLTLPSTPVMLSNDNSVALIGEVFPRNSVMPHSIVASLSGDDPLHAAEAITRNLWGRYAMICVGRNGQSCAWLRDPSGSQRLYAWHLGPHTLVADAITLPLMQSLKQRPRIDWHRLSQLIAQTEMASAFSALERIEIVTPGRLEVCENDRVTSHVIWTPASFGHAAKRADFGEFRETASLCAGHWLGDHRRVTVELSGGLDSSLVAGLLANSANRPSIQGLNIIPHSPGGDEAIYARSVSEMWGFGLIETAVHPSELDYLGLLDGALTVEPPVYGLDVVADRLSFDLADAFGATRIFSGQGGDAVFFRPQTPLIAADYLAALGPRPAFGRLVQSCAKATNSSVWAVTRQAVWPDPALDRRPLPVGLGGPVAQMAWQDAVLVHPWADDACNLPAGKRMQVAMLTNCQLFHRSTRTALHGRLVHPLLSQPLVELCLGTALWELVPDRRDRGFVRDCFSQILPEPVRNRRGKGEASGFYNRVIATHLPSLRPFLLDGLLASKGLISPDALAGLLDVQHLLWRDDHPIIGSLVALEVWARQWSDASAID